VIRSEPHISPQPLKDYSGYHPPGRLIPVIKRHQYCVVTDRSITGDAPKHFVRVYEPGSGRKVNYKQWPLYIAKLGHKHYPMESVTEHMLNRIGEVLGYRMAASRLVMIGGQIRFLSRYFIKDPRVEELVHGADIYAGYLSDKAFIDQIEREGKEREFITVKLSWDALHSTFPNEAAVLWKEFIGMLLFDAYVGNQDRHFYNWGVLRNLKNHECPRFAPIYDTARGLFWNDHEPKLARHWGNERNLSTFVEGYSEACSSKLSWDGEKEMTHFQLMGILHKNELGKPLNDWTFMLDPERLDRVLAMLRTEFRELVSEGRMRAIIACLTYRRERLTGLLA